MFTVSAQFNLIKMCNQNHDTYISIKLIVYNTTFLHLIQYINNIGTRFINLNLVNIILSSLSLFSKVNQKLNQQDKFQQAFMMC